MISREHPDWDLSFLEVEGHDVRTPGTELLTETEYEGVSNIDADVPPGATVDSGMDGRKEESHPSDVGVLEAHRSVIFEVGGPSHASSVPAADTPEVGPMP